MTPRLPERLAGAELRVQLPRLPSERMDLVVALDQVARTHGPMHRVLAGALGLCCDRLRRRLPYHGDVVAYGGQVLDLLLGEDPACEEDLAAAGLYCVHLVREARLLSQRDLDAAEDFSAPPAARSSGSSSG